MTKIANRLKTNAFELNFLVVDILSIIIWTNYMDSDVNVSVLSSVEQSDFNTKRKVTIVVIVFTKIILVAV